MGVTLSAPSIWQSLGSTDQLNTYFTTSWNAFKTNGQLPAGDWNCRFDSPDWSACFSTWWYPTMMMIMGGMVGLMVQATTNFGWLATDDTAEVKDSFENGLHSVYVWWY